MGGGTDRLSGDAATAYAKDVVAADFEAAGSGARKVAADLAAKGVTVSEPQLHAKIAELMAQAISQVKAGTYARRASFPGRAKHEPGILESLNNDCEIPVALSAVRTTFTVAWKAGSAKAISAFHPVLTGKAAIPP